MTTPLNNTLNASKPGTIQLALSLLGADAPFKGNIMTRITHKQLLDGYDCISDWPTIIQSVVNGDRIWWQYRRHTDDAWPVCDPSDADSITLDNDRTGEIDYDPALDTHPANQTIHDAIQCVIGNQL